MYRIGQSSDIHRLVANRNLVLGGIIIPNPVGQLAHSDGDVLLHAITEAIIGALGLNDLGYHFPNTIEYQDIASSKLLIRAAKMLQEHKYEIVNIDSTINLESPKLQPYILSIKENIAKILKVDIKKINVKAATMEGLGPIGNGQAVSATSIVLIKKNS